MLSYRALESIFSVIFERAEPQLNLRWVMLKNKLGLPHMISMEALREVMEFADTELSALALIGNSSQNTGLPLTDNQHQRVTQIKEADKRSQYAYYYYYSGACDRTLVQCNSHLGQQLQQLDQR